MAIAALLTGGFLGWATAGLLQGGRAATAPLAAETPDTPAEPEETDPIDGLIAPARVRTESGRKPEPPSPRGDTRRGEAESEDREDALLRNAREGIADGWSSVRTTIIPATLLEEGLVEYERVLRDSPEEIGIELARRQDELDAAADQGAVFLVLEELRKGLVRDRSDLVTDSRAFTELFVPFSQPARRDGTKHLSNPDQATEDGTILSFPRGVFRVRRIMREKNPYPRDVTIEGAGMNETLLLLDRLYTSSRLRNFAIRNCTVRVESYLFDFRAAPPSVGFENVRIIGFDTGAGSSCVIGSARPGGAFLFQNCRIEGGYGPHPENGTLFDAREPGLLARFEGCVLDLLQLEAWRKREGTVVFADCTLSNLLDRQPVDETGDTRYVFWNSTVSYLPAELRTNPPRKDLGLLFPDWRNRIQE